MTETVKTTKPAEKAIKVRIKPRPESILTPTFAASRHNIAGDSRDNRHSRAENSLQRHCDCGAHTIAGGVCHTCSQKRDASAFKRAAVREVAENSDIATESQVVPELHFGRDFVQIPDSLRPSDPGKSKAK